MESMVNLEKEFQNLYVQKNKKGHIKSVVKYFSTAQEKLFTSKAINGSHSSSPKPTNTYDSRPPQLAPEIMSNT